MVIALQRAQAFLPLMKAANEQLGETPLEADPVILSDGQEEEVEDENGARAEDGDENEERAVDMVRQAYECPSFHTTNHATF